jgi:iron donor protein CyaY
VPVTEKLLTAKDAKKSRKERQEKLNLKQSQKKIFFANFAIPLRTSRLKAFLYNLRMLDELEFRKRADEAFAALKKSLIAAEDDADIEVEDQSGALHISFEDGARFVVSPNAPVRQIWISALTTSFKLDWSDGEQDFVLAKTGEKLKPLMGRLISQQLGETLELE